MQLIPSHQVINVLTRAVKDGAGKTLVPRTITVFTVKAAVCDDLMHVRIHTLVPCTITGVRI